VDPLRREDPPLRDLMRPDRTGLRGGDDAAFSSVRCKVREFPESNDFNAFDYTVWRRVSLGRTTNPKLRDAIAG
jgi:hypothetical protein